MCQKETVWSIIMNIKNSFFNIFFKILIVKRFFSSDSLVTLIMQKIEPFSFHINRFFGGHTSTRDKWSPASHPTLHDLRGVHHRASLPWDGHLDSAQQTHLHQPCHGTCPKNVPLHFLITVGWLEWIILTLYGPNSFFVIFRDIT